MTIDGNSPSIIGALKDQLVASASFAAASGTAARVYYPWVDWASTMTIAAVLRHTNRGVSRPFVGVTIPNGELTITLYATKTIAELETLAHAIAAEICVDVGIENLTVTGIDIADVADDAKAVSSSLNSIDITLAYGLE